MDQPHSALGHGIAAAAARDFPAATPLPASLLAQLRPALLLFALLSAVTGLAYPLGVTALAQALFPAQAKGSLVERDGRVVGSALIGQGFADARHFAGRPSATSPEPWNASGSGGSNLGPGNPALTEAVRARVAALRALDPGNTAPVPVDLVTASASGLDPHISRAAADWQAARVARATGLPESRVRELIAAHTEDRLAGWLGEPRVNVLALNLALDAALPAASRDQAPTAPPATPSDATPPAAR